MPEPFYAVIIPLGGGGPDQGLPWPGRPGGGVPTPPIYHPGHPDHGLPGYPDQGLPGGPETDPPYPDQGLPGRPPHVGNRPPGSRPEYPSQGPVWGGRPGRPDQGLPGQPGVWPRPTGGNYPDQGLPPELGVGDIGPAQPWVPPAGEELPPPPAEIADQVVVAVWKPDEQAWKVAVAQGPHPAPQ